MHDDEALMWPLKNVETGEKNQCVPKKRIETHQMDRRLWKEEKEILSNKKLRRQIFHGEMSHSAYQAYLVP